ncbi:MAG: hypothetical protein HY860_00830, partial [Chlamydiales bacterium]|nr:hypothetical protein [Chlamydiales bacterium]
LRGETSLEEMLCIIKNHCRDLIVPDSGILSMTYYVDEQFPLNIYSMWSDPRQGILKQKVSSPNALLTHHPFIAEKNIERITPEMILKKITK